jgi:hypothetical protein
MRFADTEIPISVTKNNLTFPATERNPVGAIRDPCYDGSVLCWAVD